MNIAIIYDKLREDTLGEYYKKAFVKAGHAVTHFWLKDSGRIEPRFDCYLRIDDGDYKYDIPHGRLKPSFFYASDVHLKKPFLAINGVAPLYDHVFCAQYDGYLKLKAVCGDKVSWLPHACDSELHRDLGTERTIDIAFIGNDGGLPRKLLLQEIRERFPGSYIGNAPFTQISEIYSKAKIGFNYSIANDINMRVFEVMACGAMLLTNHVEGNGFDGLFEDKKNVAVYSSPQEIFLMIKRYLENNNERRAVAAAGKDLAASSHTYDKRVSAMLEQMAMAKSIG
ncbi:MAG: glycosyltransferase [Candidatus Omnitrophica bacterium]|nr:glycosyltransferase [Candidatus Omnitrophota bacterium]